MFSLNYNTKKNLITATTLGGNFDPVTAQDQIAQILSLTGLGEKVRILRIFSEINIFGNLNDVKEHFSYVQNCLNKTNIKECFVAVVTDEPLSTAMAVIYQSNPSKGNCFYKVQVFCTREAATAWLMEN